jgi:protoporphyrinogen oxidase
MGNAGQADKVNLIIGAGMTGVTAGMLLAEGGKKCVIVEKEPAPGGLCRSFELDGITFDLGPHMFFHDQVEADQLMMEVLGDEKLVTKRFSYAVMAGNRYYEFPVTPAVILSYPWKYKKEIITGFFAKTILRQRGARLEPSLENILAEKSGRSYYNEVLEGMFRKKSGVAGATLHHDWVLRVDRSADNRKEPFKELTIGQMAARIGRSLFTPVRYYYPEAGFARFAQRMLDRFTAAGGEIILGCGDVSVEKDGDKITSCRVGERKFAVENLIWTGSINQLNEKLSVSAPHLEYRGVAIIMLTYDKAACPPGEHKNYAYVYFSDSDSCFARIYQPDSVFSREGSSNEGVCIEVNVGETLDQDGMEALTRKAVDDLDRLGLFMKSGLRKEKIAVFLPDGMPLYGLDYEARMEQAFSGVRRFTNLYCVGRTGGYYFCLSPWAVSQGMKAATCILSGSGKPRG